MFLVIAFAIASSWLLLHVLIPQLRCRLPDQPNSRSSHQAPTPRGGGVSFVSLSLASSVVSLLNTQFLPVCVLPLLAVPLSFVGLLDDRFNLPAFWRYLVQILTAFLILGFSISVGYPIFTFIYGHWFFLPVIILLVVAITAVINFVNFMDGLDGLVGGSMAVSIAALSFSLKAPFPLWVLVGSLLGFLLWNWSPATVFMGDVGSTFLGAVFAGLVLQASSLSDAFSYLLVATPLLADACLCVPRRMLAGQRVFKAHRLHLFQRLNQAGWPHSRVSLIYITSTALLAVAMIFGGLPWVFTLAVAEILFGFWLDQRVALSFAVASKS